MSKFQRNVSIGFNQAGHGEHWHYTCRRAYAGRAPDAGVRPEQPDEEGQTITVKRSLPPRPRLNA